MPQKTIYLSDADAALWDQVKARLGEKSMSTLFAEYLRKTLDARDGFLHVLRAEPNVPLSDAPFAVMFAPIDDAFAQPHYCSGLATLTQFLNQLGLSDKVSESIRTGLKSQNSVSERLT